MTTELKSMVSWIRALVATDVVVDSHSMLDFDPAWHGDHWQNLLSSPMDARRYVMEDWTLSSATPLAAAKEKIEFADEEEVEPV